MIRNRKLKGCSYNPLSTLENMAEEMEEDLAEPSLPLLERLNNYSEKVREQTLVLLANLSGELAPADLLLVNDPAFLDQVLCRFEEASLHVLNAALFAVSNLCALPCTRPVYLCPRVLLGFERMVGMLERSEHLANNYFLCLATVLELF
jgi:hypothetical protein